MYAPPKLTISPPLLNTACPWATNTSDLQALYNSSSTGAITTRTSLLQGFAHDNEIHQFLFFDPSDPSSSHNPHSETPVGGSGNKEHKGSLNNLGYSPHLLSEYVAMIRDLADRFPGSTKPVIVSVTGSPEEIRGCYDEVERLGKEIHIPLGVELNLSCPNIIGSPPPAYDASSLSKYLAALPDAPSLPVGLKTPPYTHTQQFEALISALSTAGPRISFLTSTNTLGSCLILSSDMAPVLPGSGMGGMAGPSLHPLSLGNVSTLRRLLDENGLGYVDVVGVGGVSDGEGYRRMRKCGAVAVGLATALGREGVGVFDRICAESGER